MARNEPKIYHHSNVKGTVVKIIVIIIAAAVILALTAFFGFRKFIAYTDTGKLYLDIPWLYGYMDGPPAQDDLAPYLAPIESSTPENSGDNTSPDTTGTEPSAETDSENSVSVENTTEDGETTSQQDDITDTE